MRCLLLDDRDGFRPGRATFTCLVGLCWLLRSAEAGACGACVTPELWDVQVSDDEFVVVTNFGLLSPTEEGWQLTCEETIGGLLLDVQTDGAQNFVSTNSGLFVQRADLCDWNAGPVSARSDWLLSFSQVDATAQPFGFALVHDVETDEIHVERSSLGTDFEVVQTFDGTVGYRKLVAGGNPTSVFVAGYTAEPRGFQLAFSLDGGDSWNEAALETDTESTTMTLRQILPTAPAVLLVAERVVGQADEVWRFDADSGQLERLLVLEEAELFGGMTLNGDTLWVAGRHRGGGSLYRAELSELSFERVVESGPEFGCLAAHDGVLYACVNDFTYASEFILGRSADDGQTWTTIMQWRDLGEVSSCGEECRETSNWLHGSYRIVDDPDMDAGPAADKQDADVAAAVPDEGGCSMLKRSRHTTGDLALFCGGLLLTLALRRSHTFSRSPLRSWFAK